MVLELSNVFSAGIVFLHEKVQNSECREGILMNMKIARVGQHLIISKKPVEVPDAHVNFPVKNCGYVEIYRLSMLSLFFENIQSSIRLRETMEILGMDWIFSSK